MINNDDFKLDVDFERYKRQQRRKRMMARKRRERLRRKRRLLRISLGAACLLITLFLLVGFITVLVREINHINNNIAGSKTNIVLTENKDEKIYKDIVKNNSVSDSNETVSSEVEKDNIIGLVDNNEPRSIYLTFDDGPSTKVTNEMLDILKTNDIKATFFVVNYDDSKIPILKRMVKEGHTIGIHTSSHDYSECYSDDEQYIKGIDVIKGKLKKDIGYDAYCIRFPGGSSNTISENYNSGIMSRLSDKVKQSGFEYFDWNVDSGDASASNVDSAIIIDNTVNTLNPDKMNIVLMHDTDAKATTAASLQNIIDYGKENKYVFKPIAKNTNPVHHHINN